MKTIDEQAPRRRHWTRAELAIIRRQYPHLPTREIARELGRTERSVYAQANILHLRKSAAYLTSAASGRLTPLSAAGINHRFKPGQRPWNAGLKGWDAGGRSRETRFRRGNRPHTWVPIGSERVNPDGILERKMREGAWKPVHVLKWQRHRGSVPRGHVVIFRDRNPRNFRLNNLMCVTRAELMGRNTIHRYPRELKLAMRLAGRLRRTIEERA